MDSNLKTFIWGFLTIFVGVVLLDGVADATFDATTVSTVTNESVTFDDASILVTNTDNSQALIYFGNATNNTDGSKYTLGEDVNLTSTGNLTRNTVTWPGDGPYDVSYSFHGTNFVNDGTSRVFINLVPLFFAVSVMLVGVFMVVVAIRGFMGVNS